MVGWKDGILEVKKIKYQNEGTGERWRAIEKKGRKRYERTENTLDKQYNGQKEKNLKEEGKRERKRPGQN